MMGTIMDLELTADQSCSEPSSVKLNKDVRDDFLKRACAKLAAKSLCQSCAANASQMSLKSHKKGLSTSPLLSILQELRNKQDSSGRLGTDASSELGRNSTDHFTAGTSTLSIW